jgi:uncharacterized protein (DUF1697 family)
VRADKDTWIALLRGVNVGGRNLLPMKRLTAEMQALGLDRVQTYLQSGNIVFACSPDRAATVQDEIRARIADGFGFDCSVVVLGRESLAAAVSANPFPEAEAEQDGKSLHLFFASRPFDHADAPKLDAAATVTERWRIVGSVFYLHTPDGFGRSKLAANAEKCLKLPVTARNWRTATQLLKIADDAL